MIEYGKRDNKKNYTQANQLYSPVKEQSIYAWIGNEKRRNYKRGLSHLS